jgi:hypothetical protein
MKQCPQCRNTYTDETLRYCLADGTELTNIASEPETLISRDRPLRVEIEQPRPQPVVPFRPEPNRTSVAKVIVIVAGIGIILVVGLGSAFAVFVYFSGFHFDVNANKNIAVNTTATPDSEKQRLQNELTNIQRRLDEQQKNANLPQKPPPVPTPNMPGVVTARVNSPNDGFLALRDKPDADQGERIVKIPHGSLVTIENCQKNKVSIGGRSGRWCLISWDQYEGYVFDAWLIY